MNLAKANIKTIINKVESGERDTFWVSGMRFTTHTQNTIQNLFCDYQEPIQVKVFIENTRYGLSDKISIELNGRRMTRWNYMQMGLQFFYTEAGARTYFDKCMAINIDKLQSMIKASDKNKFELDELKRAEGVI